MEMDTVTFRQATEQDLDSIVSMLSDDTLGNTRERYEHPLPESYIKAFRAIESESDPNIELIVACDGDAIVGVEQVTFTPPYYDQGRWRATIEGVRTALSERGKGLGS